MASHRQYKSSKAETWPSHTCTQEIRRSQSSVSSGELVGHRLWVDVRAGPCSCLKDLVKLWILLCLRWKGRRGRNAILFKLFPWPLGGTRVEQGRVRVRRPDKNPSQQHKWETVKAPASRVTGEVGRSDPVLVVFWREMQLEAPPSLVSAVPFS